MAKDVNGRTISVGDTVIWQDPETLAMARYQVTKVHNEEVVHLWNAYGECEAHPQECAVINLKTA